MAKQHRNYFGCAALLMKSKETILDRIVQPYDGEILDVPNIPPLCDGLSINKMSVDIGDTSLYCEQDGDGIPVVLIHRGPGGTHHCFHPHFSVAAEFAKIIYYDQRGCGQSGYDPGKGYSITQASAVFAGAPGSSDGLSRERCGLWNRLRLQFGKIGEGRRFV